MLGTPSSRNRAWTFALLTAAAALFSAFTWPWDAHEPWPESSKYPVEPLAHPTLTDRFLELHSLPVNGYSFAVFGDQRALADGEWQRLIAHLGAIDSVGALVSVDLTDSTGAKPPAFIVDTGDIVFDGSASDQFAMLADLLRPVSRFPYLVGVGNHEVKNNGAPVARENLAKFLSKTPLRPTSDHLYGRVRIGPAVYYFLDSNDLVYPAEGHTPPIGEAKLELQQPDIDRSRVPRVQAQLEWIESELPPASDDSLRIVILHHPFLQSSSKHIETASALWNLSIGRRRFVDLLLDAGVDVVLTGHTHTFESFRVTREDARSLRVINFSGRPRTSFLWTGDGARRARNLGDREHSWLDRQGFLGLGSYRVEQLEVMLPPREADQVGIFRVGADGSIAYDVHYLDDGAPDGIRVERGAPIP